MSQLKTGHDCWRIARAEQASIVIDAEEYYAAARQAMLQAKHQIFLVGWDFDARIRLSAKDDCPEAPDTIGALITWLVQRRPKLNVYVLRWDKGALKSLFRGSTLLTLTRWRFLMRQIHLKLDGVHPVGASQHQKIAVIDDCVAFCGGIDMTEHRWDTREHRDPEPRRRGVWGFAYKPWHDATTALQGPVAAALGELCRARWAIAGGAPIAPPPPTAGCWPDRLAADFTDINVAISRSQPECGDQARVLEIEHLYLGLIARVRRRLYVESQYFASRRIAEAIARRLGEADGPEIVIINPVRAQGFIEPIAMDSARARLMKVLAMADTHGRLRMYHPVTARGRGIYCHAKILIADDAAIRVGSSNFNNRSLRLDTECDVTIEAGSAVERARIETIRDGLLAEHLGVEPAVVSALLADGGSLIAAIETLRGAGKTLVPYRLPRLGRFMRWLADHEVLDPEGPEQMFTPIDERRGLVRGLRNRLRQRRRGWYGRR